MLFQSKKPEHLKKTIVERIEEKWPLNSLKKGSPFQIGYIAFVVAMFLPIGIFVWFVIEPIFGPICDEYIRYCSFNMVIGSVSFIIIFVGWLWFMCIKRF